MSEQEKISEHNALVRKVEKALKEELGLLIYPKTKPFTSGFIPDILTNVDATNNGWVIIDVINGQDSLVRDIGGLLVCKANAEHAGSGVRAVFALASRNVTDTEAVEKLIKNVSDFNLIAVAKWSLPDWKYEKSLFDFVDKSLVNNFIADMRTLVIWDALTERLQVMNDWYVNSVMDSACLRERQIILEEKLHAGFQILEAKT